MADFQNVGNFDAGVFTPKLGGVAPSGSSFTMDAAGIASGGAFLTSELEKRDPLIRKPLTSVTYARDIPIQTGGGWVDYVTAMNVAYGITGGSGSGAVGAGGANGTPIIQANVAKGAYKAHLFSAALRVNFVDMQRSNLIGRSLDQLLQDGIRLTYDKHMDANVYTGFEDYGTTGLMNNPNVTETTAASNGADSSSTKWKDKTPQQILKDVNDLLSAVWASCEYDTDAIPNHILLPYEQYNYILTTMVSDLASETIYDFLMKNNAAVKNGGELFIGGCRWCKGAGTGKTDRMVGHVMCHIQPHGVVPAVQPFVRLYADIGHAHDLIQQSIRQVTLAVGIAELRIFFLELLSGVISDAAAEVRRLLADSTKLCTVDHAVLLTLPQQALRASPQPWPCGSLPAFQLQPECPYRGVRWQRSYHRPPVP